MYDRRLCSPVIKGEDVRGIVNKVSKHINEQFINGKVASAKSFILNSALVAQNKHALPLTEKVNTGKFIHPLLLQLLFSNLF